MAIKWLPALMITVALRVGIIRFTEPKPQGGIGRAGRSVEDDRPALHDHNVAYATCEVATKVIRRDSGIREGDRRGGPLPMMVKFPSPVTGGATLPESVRSLFGPYAAADIRRETAIPGVGARKSGTGVMQHTAEHEVRWSRRFDYQSGWRFRRWSTRELAGYRRV